MEFYYIWSHSQATLILNQNNKSITLFHSMLWIMGCQFMGFGFAGLCRRFLVIPAAMWWPDCLSTVALFVSFHENENQGEARYKISRYKFFWISCMLMFLYSWIPEFFLSALQLVSFLCFFGPKSSETGGLSDFHLFSSATAGVGLFSFTFDWSYIGSFYV